MNLKDLVREGREDLSAAMIAFEEMTAPEDKPVKRALLVMGFLDCFALKVAESAIAAVTPPIKDLAAEGDEEFMLLEAGHNNARSEVLKARSLFLGEGEK